jgi:hypothetical protein
LCACRSGLYALAKAGVNKKLKKVEIAIF